MPHVNNRVVVVKSLDDLQGSENIWTRKFQIRNFVCTKIFWFTVIRKTVCLRWLLPNTTRIFVIYHNPTGKICQEKGSLEHHIQMESECFIIFLCVLLFICRPLWFTCCLKEQWNSLRWASNCIMILCCFMLCQPLFDKYLMCWNIDGCTNIDRWSIDGCKNAIQS